MKKILFSIIITVILFSSNISVANAAATHYNNKLSSGTNIAYMIQPGNEYTVSIPNAVYKLMYPTGMTNNLVLNPTNDYLTSKLDFYQYYTPNNVNAYAGVFEYNGADYMEKPDRELRDWLYGEVHINDYKMNNYSNIVRDAVVIHEMLHVYSLKDLTNSNSIMYQSTPLVTGLTSDANAILNLKY